MPTIKKNSDSLKKLWFFFLSLFTCIHNRNLLLVGDVPQFSVIDLFHLKLTKNSIQFFLTGGQHLISVILLIKPKFLSFCGYHIWHKRLNCVRFRWKCFRMCGSIYMLFLCLWVLLVLLLLTTHIKRLSVLPYAGFVCVFFKFPLKIGFMSWNY